MPPAPSPSPSEAHDLQREVGQDIGRAISLNNLGGFAVDTGDFAEAREWLRECVKLGIRLGYKEVLAHALSTYARMAAADERWRAVARWPRSPTGSSPRQVQRSRASRANGTRP